ncbi:BatD family protein [Aquella oligotrophica]|uniref:DUF7939 domain-containing protein n=1 Tax=Aquella oligotrophica TaxID=2067065 RepID=A0A2I7N7U4_9NEIS|nr:BatD family protein [Aquella oligotrophica]AUR52510.1 hypothetical protein CUN60_09430 [Aquella oligotrophica]
MNKKILFSSLLLLIAGNVFATVSASVDRSQIALGQSFTLTINLPDSNDTPNLDVLKSNFEIYGTSTSSQTNIINGKVNSQNTLTVNLIPKNPGKQLIPAIKVGNDATAPISIEVSEGDSNNKVADAKDSAVYLEASVGKQSLYVGVPFLYTVKLYFNVSLSNLSMEPLNIDGAQIEAQGKPIQYQSNENGKTYQVVEQRFMVTPNKSGKLTIPPAKIRGAIADNDNNSFFPMMANKPFMANSKPVNLEVKAVPANIAINQWFPAKNVKATDSWSISSDTLKVGEPLTHTISLEALGVPATSIPELEINNPAEVNAYPDKAQSSTNSNNGELTGTKTFKIAYIPTKAGTLSFPTITIKWWDITADTLKTVTIPAKTYTVTADPTTPANQNLSASQISSANNTGNSEKTVTKIKPENPLWKYLTFLFAGLWLITLGFMLKLSRKRKISNPQQSSTDISVVDFASNKSINITTLKEACNSKNISATCNALINWAQAFSDKKIYTISDINSVIFHEKLANLIQKLNSATYNDEKFDNFDSIPELIKSIESRIKKPIKKNTLGELYPK